MSNFNSKLTIATTLALLLTGCITINATSLDFNESKNLSLSAKEITQLNIDAAAGYLKIIGDDSISDIQVTANIEAYNEDFKLSLKSNGDYAELEADANPGSHIQWGNNSAKIDLTVRLPSNMKLKVKDGSGKITITNIKNNVKIDDGSGSMDITDIQGSLEIEDGSGNITVDQVSGNINIDDNSGNMEIEKVGGTLNIEDGSGNIIINQVSGNIDIDDDSGTINIEIVGGSLNIKDRSGDIDITDVSGLVTIDDGSGDINLKTLHKGLTIVEEGSGGLKMDDIKGSVSIK